MTAAAVIASQDAQKPLSAYAKTPYYYGYPSRCDTAGPAYCSGFNSSDDQSDANVLEYVTVPNNPDGYYREQVYKKQVGQSVCWKVSLNCF